MPSAASTSVDHRPPRALHAVGGDEQRTSATQFSECVRAVVQLCRRRGLKPPVYRSPPRIEGVDRSILRRANGTVIVAVRRGQRPLAAVRADVIEGAIVANQLTGESADRFRGLAWAAVDGGPADAAADRGAAAPAA
ncbi:MAG: hypothetical protein M3Y51_02725, partial [Actinomycetota bacterium]|nr:hypothetical protein [Actinomycetota bacterium]